jgi:pectin methylesterase-like acyl-CoA thioesterase/protocatechuate 3,4-dioxygenase beta subunit
MLAALTACGGSSSSPTTPTPSAPTPTALAFSVQPSAVVAGALVAPAVEVAVLDADGNVVSTATSISLALSAGGTLRGTASATAVGGHASFADLSIHEAGTGYTLTATTAGLTSATSATFAVRPAAVDPSASDFVVAATTATAGGSVALSVTLRDAYANLVPGVDVAFEATGTANSLVQPIASTSAAGAASGSFSSTRAEAKTLTARANGVALAAHPTVTFVAAAPASAGSSLVASPTSADDDGSPVTLTATIGDAYGNPVAGVAVTFDSTGVASIVQPGAVTSAAGTTAGAVSALVPGPQTFSASVAGTPVAQRDVTFTAAPADGSQSTVVASPASVPADGASTSTITVTVKDHLGRPVQGVTVALGAVPSAAVSPASVGTDGSGVATFTVSSAAVTSVLLAATVNPGASQVVIAQQATVTFITPPVTGITVTGAGNATTIASIGGTLQLTATVLPALATQTVTWSSSAPGTISVDASGLATANGYGQATLSAAATDGSGAVGSLVLTALNGNFVIFEKQAGATGTASANASASLSGGVITASAIYTASGNAFKYNSSGYYGTESNGFVALPYALVGDFTLTARMTITTVNKTNNACGIGLGVTTGFEKTDRYAFAVLTNPPTGSTVGAASTRYASSANTVVADPMTPAFTFTAGTASPTTVDVTFSRTGPNYTVSFAAGGVTASKTYAASAFTDGTTAFGPGPVYPALSFNNVVASITGFVVKDGAGTTLFDSATGTLVPGGTLKLSAISAAVTADGPTTLTAAASAIGTGAPALISAVAANPSLVDVEVVGTTITLNSLQPGNTTLTVTNLGDWCLASRTKTIPVYVQGFNVADPYGSIAAKAYPAPGETQAYADGELSLAFDAAPVLTAGGSINVYNADGTLADRIFFANESQVVNGVTVNVGPQLARVSGNTVYFTPHFGKLVYGQSYYVGISQTSIVGTLNGQPFSGFSNNPAVATWHFTVRAAPSLTSGVPVTVDGAQAQTSADFRTVGGALMYLAAHPIASATAVTVNVAAGTYNELVNYRAASANPGLTITLSGPAGNSRGDTCVIQYTNGNGWNGQSARASFYFAGANLVLQNLTLKNNAVRATLGQAEAMYFDSRAGYTMAANNCSFISRQDTIQTSGRTWIYNSYIEGNTDFIWGIADAALFESCSLRVVNDAAGQTYSMLVARTGTTGASTIGKGFVLLNSTVSVDSGIFVSYGRDAGQGSFYDQVALLNNTFTGAGALAAGLWVTTTAPLSLGDSTYVGWKASGNTGLGAESMATATGTASSIADVATEYDTRDHILNRVVTVSAGTPTGYADASTTWDLSGLVSAWIGP